MTFRCDSDVPIRAKNRDISLGGWMNGMEEEGGGGRWGRGIRWIAMTGLTGKKKKREAE